MLHEYTAMPSSVTLITAVLNLQAVQIHCYAQHSMHPQNWPAKLLVPAPVAACQTGRFPPFHQVSCQDCWHPFLHSESAENPVQAVADLHLRHYNLAVPLWVQQLAVYSETHCYLLPYYAYNQSVQADSNWPSGRHPASAATAPPCSQLPVKDVPVCQYGQSYD